MADRGYTIEEFIFPRRVKLSITAFTNVNLSSQMKMSQLQDVLHM